MDAINYAFIKLFFFVISIGGIYSDEFADQKSYYLDDYVFIPILDDCYQLYHNNNLTSPCRREPSFENQTCIQWIIGENKCLGLVTPTKETVLLNCLFEVRFDKCFKVYDSNGNENTICQQIFEGHSVGITTPDNFTVLFYDYFCRTANSLIERQLYSNFVNHFSLDVEAKSCYKVYGREEVVTPYNCLSEDIYDACVFGVSNGCTGLMTPNNEVLVLDCPDKFRKPSQKNCFYLYTSDNQIHTVCQEKVEERCVGIVTPSNLTILLECFFCSESMKLVYHNDETRRRYRNFVRNSLDNEYLGRNLNLYNYKYKVFNKNLFGSSFAYLDTISHWIPKTSCLGLTLESNETITLNCMVQNEKQEDYGCFKLVTSENETQSICAKVLNEACVGVTTSTNWSVALACYSEHYGTTDSTLEEVQPEWAFLLQSLSDYVNGGHIFKVGDSYTMQIGKNYLPVADKVHQVKKIDHGLDCLGLQTETEIIVLECSGMRMRTNGCFNIIKGGYEFSNKSFSSDKEVESVCVKVLDGHCIGIVTPDTWILPFTCYLDVSEGRISESSTNNEKYESDYPLLGSMLYGIPDNSKPPRYRRNLQ